MAPFLGKVTTQMGPLPWQGGPASQPSGLHHEAAPPGCGQGRRHRGQPAQGHSDLVVMENRGRGIFFLDETFSKIIPNFSKIRPAFFPNNLLKMFDFCNFETLVLGKVKILEK